MAIPLDKDSINGSFLRNQRISSRMPRGVENPDYRWFGAPPEKLRKTTNVVIAYNSMLLSGLLNRYLATGNEKAVDLLRRISPAAWQHLHFLGHYAFRDKRHPIDLEAILAGIVDWE